MMKKRAQALTLFILFILIIQPSVALVVASSDMWSRTYDRGYFDNAHCLVETSDGGYAMAGWTMGPLHFLLVKTNKFGSFEWSQTYGGESGEVAEALVQTFDGGYAIAGYTYASGTDSWLVKTDEYGNMEWNQTYGGEKREMANSLVKTAYGGYAIAGCTESFGAGSLDFWLIKTDANGIVHWNQTYGGAESDIAEALVKTSDGGFALAGSTHSFGAGDADFWLIKTSGSGSLQWQRTYGGTGYDSAFDLVETFDGGFALAGRTQSFGAGSDDFWLVKTDANGVMEWNRTYGGAKYEYVSSLIQTSDGGFALVGTTYSFGAGSTDFWLVKTNANGNMEWNQTYGGTRGDGAAALVETSDGGYVIAGTKTKGGNRTDFFYIKTDEHGVIPEFPSWIILPLFLLATIFAGLIKRKISVNPKNMDSESIFLIHKTVKYHQQSVG